MVQPGEFVGAYQLVRHLGEGPFGTVWLARASNGASCALKLLRSGFIERPEGRAAFTRLAASVQIHVRLSHLNLVRIYAAVQDAGRNTYGVAMEYVDGQTLAATRVPPAVVAGQDLVGLGVILSWFEELGAALSWLHSQRIVHGNLKPSNVMLTQQPGRSVVKLLDLSWAAIGIAAPPAGAAWSLAPEQLRGHPPTTMSDQWALASMLQRMLSGGAPALTLGALPQVLVMAVQRAQSSSPEQRYPHMSEFVSALRAIRMEIEQRARASTPGRRSPARMPDGRVDPMAFEEEPETVRQQNLLRNPPMRDDTPPLSPSTPADLSPTALVPAARSISDEISGQFLIETLKEDQRYGDEPLTDESSGPKRRLDVGDPFSQPLSTDDFGEADAGGLDIPIGDDDGPSTGIAVPVQDTHEDEAPGPTLPATPSSRSSSRLTAFGVVFMVIAALIAVAALTILGEEGADRPTTPEATRVAAERSEPEDMPQPEEKAPEPEPPPEKTAEVKPPAPPKAKPPPAKRAPPPQERKPPPAKPAPPPQERKPPPVKKAPPPRPTKKPPPRRELDDLDAQADAALAKLLGDAPPPTSDTSVGCDEGDANACVTLGARLEKQKKRPQARKAYERGCDFGSADGCHRAAKLHPDGSAEAKALQKKACEQGRQESCVKEEAPKTKTEEETTTSTS